MRFSWLFPATVLLVLVTGAKCKRKFDGDFEFDEEDYSNCHCQRESFDLCRIESSKQTDKEPDQPTNQPVNQPTDQPTNQPTNHWLDEIAGRCK
ncbi:proteoglycan Cow [Vespula maculifrons]|uniref:Proteoglycan Cow n=1 Tax=Vespula maculifrons TaxID=7453 RepID=A0ABD2BXR6_VESMC